MGICHLNTACILLFTLFQIDYFLSLGFPLTRRPKARFLGLSCSFAFLHPPRGMAQQELSLYLLHSHIHILLPCIHLKQSSLSNF